MAVRMVLGRFIVYPKSGTVALKTQGGRPRFGIGSLLILSPRCRTKSLLIRKASVQRSFLWPWGILPFPIPRTRFFYLSEKLRILETFHR